MNNNLKDEIKKLQNTPLVFIKSPVGNGMSCEFPQIINSTTNSKLLYEEWKFRCEQNTELMNIIKYYQNENKNLKKQLSKYIEL